MKHVIQAEHLASDKVFIFGKGPSFDPTIEIPKGCKVYTINQTAIQVYQHHNIDLCICNDLEPLLDVLLTSIRHAHTGIHFALPVSIHRDEVNIFRGGDVVGTVIERAGFTPWFFDLHTGSLHHFGGPSSLLGDDGILPFDSATTYISALIIALHHGAKTIYTNGIDGGKKRHKTFKETHQTYKPNYDLQFKQEKMWLKQFNAEVVHEKRVLNPLNFLSKQLMMQEA